MIIILKENNYRKRRHSSKKTYKNFIRNFTSQRNTIPDDFQSDPDSDIFEESLSFFSYNKKSK